MVNFSKVRISKVFIQSIPMQTLNTVWSIACFMVRNGKRKTEG